LPLSPADITQGKHERSHFRYCAPAHHPCRPDKARWHPLSLHREVTSAYSPGCTCLKSFENLGDEILIENADASVVVLRDFVERHCGHLRPNNLIYDHVCNCKDSGLTDKKIKANPIGPILISARNTMGISCAFFLSNLIRYPDVRRRPQDEPGLLDKDNVILQFLRRLGQVFIRYLPDSAYVDDSEIEMDGSWVSERIITSMPIRLVVYSNTSRQKPCRNMI
jgi:hypothetical protein